MSDAHKQALAEGREQGRAVRRYLEAIEAHKPKRGRKRTPDSIRKRLATIDERIGSADPLSRLQMVQERMDLQRSSPPASRPSTSSGLEKDFVGAARAYGDRKGITYAAWRDIGVDPSGSRRPGSAGVSG